jgi:broad-specificity NMP kinase
MTVTLRNVDAQFLNVIESLLSLRQNIQIETYEETPNELTQKVISDSEKGLNLSPIYTSTSDFMAALNA